MLNTGSRGGINFNMVWHMVAAALTSHRRDPADLVHQDSPEVEDEYTMSFSDLSCGSSILRSNPCPALETTRWSTFELVLVYWGRRDDDDFCPRRAFLVENWVLDDLLQGLNISLQLNMLALAGYTSIVGTEEDCHDLNLWPCRSRRCRWEEALQCFEAHGQGKARKSAIDDI